MNPSHIYTERVICWHILRLPSARTLHIHNRRPRPSKRDRRTNSKGVTRDEYLNAGINRSLLDNPPCREISKTVQPHMIATSNLAKQRPTFFPCFLPILLNHPSRGFAHIERFAIALLIRLRLPNRQSRFVHIFNIDRNHFRHTQ